MSGNKKQNVMNGAFALVVSTMLVKVIGLVYKIPLTAFIGEVGRGYFNAAYNIYTPVFAISMAGLPVAMSSMVSKNVALGRYADARKIFRTAFLIFIAAGIAGTLTLMLLAYPYSVYLIRSRQTLLSVLCIAPSVFFCCAMAAYRGYYEGLSDMTPTALSQIIEAIGKMALGLLFAYIIMRIGVSQIDTGTVFGIEITNAAQGHSVIYPYSAAGAVLGVSAGTVISLIYLIILKRIKKDGFTKADIKASPRPQSGRKIARELIKTALPVVASSLILNITNLIDAITVQSRLACAIARNIGVIRNMYASSLGAANTLDSDISTYLYGVYGAALDFRNLVPAITATLGISAIPAISSAWARESRCEIKETVNSVIKAAMLISLPAGFGMAVLSGEILTFVYGGTRSENLIAVAAPMLSVYGFATPLTALSAPATNMLQAIGRSDIPVKALFIGSLVKIVCNYILVGNPYLNINGAPIGSVLCYIAVVIIELSAIIHLTSVKTDVKNIFIKPIFAACLMAFAAFYMNFFISEYISLKLSVMICVVLSAILYTILLFLFKIVTKNDIFLLPGGEKFLKLLEKYKFLV